MPKREGNRTDRRIAAAGTIPAAVLVTLAGSIRYTGSGLHKLRPGDWGFHPPSNPRPHKSLCDELRPLLREEALALFSRGIERGMVSRFAEGQRPKYVWAVDDQGEAYEAKESRSEPGTYHGYRLSEDDGMRKQVLRRWRA